MYIQYNYAYIGNSIEYIDELALKYIAEVSSDKKAVKEQVLEIMYPKVLSCVNALLYE